MIVIKLLGIDQFNAQELVRDIHLEAAKIFETNPEEIIFYAPDSFLIYKGVEQTSYQLNIEVEAPKKYEPLEEKIASCLIKLFNTTHIHVRVLFTYFDVEHEYNYVNPDYPRYMQEDNMVHFDYEENSDDVYLGNAFEGYEKKVEEKEKEQNKQEAERLHHHHHH
ncbi:MAG: hypothetical protein IAC78_04495 [Firmicutes bacterium]|uniref:Tautomerase family protein n=1 Tax=Candidatus Scatoplasma merdavium TaxID=2840932 RepID=A0A9D9DAX7_9BACL|nr:hypothetical protein [Candidatus Scatoplasma merdavium]